jgi:glutamate racemase
MKIGVFDSGKGGTTVLEAIKKVLPNEEYKYIGDSKNCPYGEKSDEELMRIVRGIVDELYDWGAEIIVIACNTATAKCIDKLRELYPKIEFVGTEPAIKLAVATEAENILVMATPGTVESERLHELVRDNKMNNQKIELLACAGLADVIEKDENVDEVLSRLLEGKKNYDVVVLGCTHYSLIRDRIQKYFPEALLIDGNDGVASRVQQIVQKQ